MCREAMEREAAREKSALAAVAVEALALLAEREDRRRPGDGEVAGQVRKVFITKTLR